ncbi:MAG: AAA family ATPase [Candidatus Riflebacteria bacterium]|nr:AAA family ATPase [Candidatus Riflebacteria bacterium]
MAKCIKCGREMPLSGRCPMCEKPQQGGFSLNRFIGKNPSDQQKVQPPPTTLFPKAPPVEPEIPEQTPNENEGVSETQAPFPASNVTPLRPNQGSSILSELRMKETGNVPVVQPPDKPDKTDLPSGLDTPSAHTTQLKSVTAFTPPPTGKIREIRQDTQPLAPQQFGGASGDAGTTTGERVRVQPILEKLQTGKQKIIETTDDSPGNTSALSLYASKTTGFGDEEMETSLLSGLLNDSFILDQATSRGLIPDLFSVKLSRHACKAIFALREENKESSMIDKIVLKNKLKNQGIFDMQMQNYLDRIFSQPVPTLDQVLNYIELLKEQGLKRKLKELSESITDYINNPAKTGDLGMEQFTNKMITELREVQKAKTTKKINLIREEMRDIMHDVERRETDGEIEIIGYSFEPFHFLNLALSGFRKGFLYAIAGAPRRGKTTFTLDLATSVATNCKVPVLFFTYEQTKKNLTYRLLAKESRLNPDSLQRKKIRSDMIMDAKFVGGWKKMQAYMDYFYIVEASKADTVDRIRSYAYNVMQDFNTQELMIFVDYIQKMPLSRNYMDEKFKVEEISTELKGLTIELNIPIMTISSLSKEGCMIDATESAERPTMYHCKGSGDLEYDLDCAMIQAKDWSDTRELHNQLMQKAEEHKKDPTRVPRVDVVNLYLDKNRDAPEGIYSTMQYLFFIEDNKFIELGPKFDDDRFRYSKIENLVSDLIEKNYIVFFDRQSDQSIQKGRVNIKLKNS